MLKPSRLDLYLIVALLVGVILLLSGYFLREWPIGQFLVLGLGSGLVAAAILGFTVEKALSQNLAADAVEAALGYTLQPEMREEMRRVYDTDFVCVSHNSTFSLRPTGHREFVFLHQRTIRTIRNQTNRPCKYSPQVLVNQWFKGNMHSDILFLRATFNDAVFDTLEYTVSGNRLTASLNQPIQIGPKQDCTVVYETQEVKNLSDIFVLTLAQPTMNPSAAFRNELVNIDGMPRLQLAVGFGSSLHDRIRVLGTDVVDLPGMLLSYGYIEVLWWEAEPAQKWQREWKSD